MNNIRYHEIIKLYELDVNWKNIYVDTSGFKDGSNPVEKVLKCTYLNGHIIYGSGTPILEPFATVFQLESVQMNPKERESILTGENYFVV